MQWYIMTSPATDAATQQYFLEHDHFGLRASQVHFFQQVCGPLIPAPSPSTSAALCPLIARMVSCRCYCIRVAHTTRHQQDLATPVNGMLL